LTNLLLKLQDSLFNTSGRHVFPPAEWAPVSALSENSISRSKPKTIEPANLHISAVLKPLESSFIRNGDDLHPFIQDAADWMENQQASQQERNEFKNQTILQKAA